MGLADGQMEMEMDCDPQTPASTHIYPHLLARTDSPASATLAHYRCLKCGEAGNALEMWGNGRCSVEPSPDKDLFLAVSARETEAAEGPGAEPEPPFGMSFPGTSSNDQ